MCAPTPICVSCSSAANGLGLVEFLEFSTVAVTTEVELSSLGEREAVGGDLRPRWIMAGAKLTLDDWWVQGVMGSIAFGFQIGRGGISFLHPPVAIFPFPFFLDFLLLRDSSLACGRS